MNDIQTICMHLQMVPINGLINNKLSEQSLKLLKGTEGDITWALLDGVDKVVIETCHDLDVPMYDKNRLKQAKFYFKGIDKPLVLNAAPAHPAFPRFPEQLFSTNDNKLIAKNNPYFQGDTDYVYYRTLILYIALESMTGYENSEKTFKTVELNCSSETIDVKHTDVFKEELKEKLLLTISNVFESNKEAYITHFIINFMEGMQKKIKQSLKEIFHDGKPAVQNHFEPTEWKKEDQVKYLDELLGEISLDRVSENCPAYIHQSTRLNRYIRTILADIMEIKMPLTKKTHGIKCATWEEFYNTTEGILLISSYENALLKELKQSCMTLGVLLMAFHSIKPNKYIN
jgi:hypothetical protein